LAPAAAALVEAVRAHERAGNAIRAASLGLRLEALYPNERTAQRTAQRVLRQASSFVRVDVECAECTIQVDGTVMDYPSFFIEPGHEHTVEAAFEHGSRTQTVQGSVGERRTLHFDAPPPPPQPPPPPPVQVQPTPAGGIGVIPIWATIGAAAATVILGGVLIWSGVDTLDGVPAYEMNPTVAALADGQARENRTNWLIGVTSALALVTVVLAIFTDWDGAPAPVNAALLLDRDGVSLSLAGRF
jgi:hypothetical protein